VLEPFSALWARANSRRVSASPRPPRVLAPRYHRERRRAAHDNGSVTVINMGANSSPPAHQYLEPVLPP